MKKPRCELLPGRRPYGIAAVEKGEYYDVEDDLALHVALEASIEIQTGIHVQLVTMRSLAGAQRAWRVMQPGPPVTWPGLNDVVVRYYEPGFSYLYRGQKYLIVEHGYAIYLCTGVWWVTLEDVCVAWQVRARRGCGRPRPKLTTKPNAKKKMPPGPEGYGKLAKFSDEVSDDLPVDLPVDLPIVAPIKTPKAAIDEALARARK